MQENYKQSDNKTGEKNQLKLDKSQKIAVIFLAFFSFLVFTMWIVTFKQRINAPLRKDQVKYSSNQAAENEQVSAEDELKNKDTDKDGLSDWDELNIYNTSPYLEDSDSDGFTDKQEIDSDNDPNCPNGQDCYGQAQEIEGTKTTEGGILSQKSGSLASGTTTGQTLSGLDSSVDAVKLREVLLQAGMDKATLDQITDQELLSSYKEILNNNSLK